MATRKHPCLVAGRFTDEERGLIELVVRMKGVSVNQFVRSVVLPEVRHILSESFEASR